MRRDGRAPLRSLAAMFLALMSLTLTLPMTLYDLAAAFLAAASGGTLPDYGQRTTTWAGPPPFAEHRGAPVNRRIVALTYGQRESAHSRVHQRLGDAAAQEGLDSLFDDRLVAVVDIRRDLAVESTGKVGVHWVSCEDYARSAVLRRTLSLMVGCSSRVTLA